MNKLLISAAVVALAGAAHAQEAFITQIGDDNVAANIAVGGGDTGNTQVIAQQGDGLAAANLTRGEGNTAYTYQIVDGTYCNGNPLGCLFGFNLEQASASSLIWQTETAPDSLAQGNDAVHVQLHNQGGFGPAPSYVAQTIQAGDNNTAVNWQQDGNAGAVPLFAGGLAAPTLTLTPMTTNPPTPIVNTGIPFGGNVLIN